MRKFLVLCFAMFGIVGMLATACTGGTEDSSEKSNVEENAAPSGGFGGEVVNDPESLLFGMEQVEECSPGPSAYCAGANLENVDWPNEDLTGAVLKGANLTDGDLSDTTLDGTNLQGTNLTGANLLGAKIVGAFFLETVFDGTVMPDGSICNEVDAVGCNLSL